MKKSVLFFRRISAFAFMTILFSGCGDNQKAPQDPYSDMTPGLRKLQGSWTDTNTNNTSECTVIFQDFTIRVRYQESPDTAIHKQNASIDRMDEERKLILINGGTGAWNYDFPKTGAEETLMLEFFSQDGWHTALLNRSK